MSLMLTVYHVKMEEYLLSLTVLYYFTAFSKVLINLVIQIKLIAGFRRIIGLVEGGPLHTGVLYAVPNHISIKEDHHLVQCGAGLHH